MLSISLHIYIYIYMYLYIYTYEYTYLHPYFYLSIYIYMHIYIYIHIQYIYIYLHMFMCVSIYTHIFSYFIEHDIPSNHRSPSSGDISRPVTLTLEWTWRAMSKAPATRFGSWLVGSSVVVLKGKHRKFMKKMGNS